MKKTILLTGATGFLGSHLLERFLKDNYKLIILKRSFSDIWRIKDLISEVNSYDVDKVDLKRIFKENKINYVVHTATNYGRKGEPASQILRDNLLFSLELSEQATFFNIDTFFNTDTLQYKYLNNYTLSKKQFAEWLKNFAESEKIKIVNLKIEHMYGPKDDDNKFVMWLVKQLLDDVPEIKLTKGEQKRDFIFIDDVVDAFSKVLLESDLKNFNEFEVGTGKSIPLKHFINVIKNEIEKRKKIITKLNFGALDYRTNEPMQIKVDNNKLIKLGWSPKIEIYRGVELLINSKMGGDEVFNNRWSRVLRFQFS